MMMQTVTQTNMVKNRPRFNGTHFVIPMLGANEIEPSEEFSPLSAPEVGDDPVFANPMHTTTSHGHN
jgi:hypothetical protein